MHIRIPDEVISHIYSWVAWPHAIMSAADDLTKYFTEPQRLALDIFRVDRTMSNNIVHIVAFVTNRLNHIKNLGVRYDNKILETLSCIRGTKTGLLTLPAGIRFGKYGVNRRGSPSEEDISALMEDIDNTFDVKMEKTQNVGSPKSIAYDIYFSKSRANKPEYVECDDMETLMIYLRKGNIDHIYHALMSYKPRYKVPTEDHSHALIYMIRLLLLVNKKRQ